MSRSAREEVWLALSDLFLDTDVGLHHDYIVRTLIASPFDLVTLDRIFIEEIFPVCIFNLHDIAGEWAGFHEDWLFPKVAQQQGKRPMLGRLTLALRWRQARRMVPAWFTLRAALVDQGKTQRTQAVKSIPR